MAVGAGTVRTVLRRIRGMRRLGGGGGGGLRKPVLNTKTLTGRIIFVIKLALARAFRRRTARICRVARPRENAGRTLRTGGGSSFRTNPASARARNIRVTRHANAILII